MTTYNTNVDSLMLGSSTILKKTYACKSCSVDVARFDKASA